MKRAIVTGATGFIGSHFVEYLLDNGIEVLALGRKELGEIMQHRRDKLSKATYLCLDMKNIESLNAEIEKIGWDVGDSCIFFNLAWGGVDILSDLDIEAQMKNVHYSVSALEVAHKLRCSRFVHVGTMEEAFTYKYLELDHTKNSEYNRHVIYSVAKIAAKNALKIKAKLLGMDMIYVLHSHVMGVDDEKDSFLQVTLQKLIDKDELVFSSGKQYFDVISARDCCNGYLLICQKGLSGAEYWVGSGEPKPLREYVERMYALFPSGKEMQFGKLSYNDIMLEQEDFSIESLSRDTGYFPMDRYEQTVKELHEHLMQM